MASPTEITPQQLNRLIGTPQCPVLIDVRIEDDFAEEPFLIPGAKRFDFQDIDQIIAYLQNRHCVIYCQKGLKISQGVAALLRLQNISAETLQGGHYAWQGNRISNVVH